MRGWKCGSVNEWSLSLFHIFLPLSISNPQRGTSFVWDWLFDAAPCSTGPLFPLFMEHGINYIYCMCFSMYMQHMPNPYGRPRAGIGAQPRVINTQKALEIIWCLRCWLSLVSECDATLKWLSDFIDGECRECFYYCKQSQSGQRMEENFGFSWSSLHIMYVWCKEITNDLGNSCAVMSYKD